MANELFPRDPKTIKQDLRCAVNSLQSYIKRSSSTAISRFHIICDAWTSPNGYAIWGIQAQCLDSKLDLQCITIGLERLRSSHDGRTLASVTYETIEHYGFTKSLGYAILDNASTNDTLTDMLASPLSDINVDWDPKQHRLRCFGHVINLAASAFIYIEPKDMLPADEAAGWRMFGCFGKLYNLVMYVQASSQRREKLKAFTDELNLHRDNATRWISWWITLDRALRDTMKAGIIAFCDTEPNIRAERLSPGDWDNLADMHRFIRPFYAITIATQGVFDAIDKVLPAMDYLLMHLETERRVCMPRSFMAPRIDTAWAKFVQYYGWPTMRSHIFLQPRKILYINGIASTSIEDQCQD